MVSASAFLFAACDEAELTAPVIKPAPFALTAQKHDSLYWDENGEIVGYGFGNEPDSLSLFVGTSQTNILSASDTLIIFKVAKNASSSDLRLYRRDSLALGSPRLTVIQQLLTTLPEPKDFSPKAAYTEEHIMITGNDLLQKQSDIDVFIGDRKLEIDSISSTSIRAKITDSVKSGEVQLRVRTYVIPLGEFDRLEHIGVKRFNTSFKSISIDLDSRITFRLFKPDGTEKGPKTIDVRDNYTIPLEGTAIRIIGDSLLCESTSSQWDTMRLELRMKLDPQTSRLSGHLSIERTRSALSERYSRLELLLEGSLVRELKDQLLIESVSPDAKNGLSISGLRNDVISGSDSTTMYLQRVDPEKSVVNFRLMKF